MNNALIKTKVKNPEVLEKAVELLRLIGVEIISVETEENITNNSNKNQPDLTNFHQKMTKKFGEMPVLSEEEAKEILNEYYQNHV